MGASKRVLIVALACLSNICLSSFAAAQPSDQVIAERVLGPQWRQIARRAGMIFAGTLLAAESPTAATDRATPGATPAVQLSFRVDEAIAGVDRGQILTIHEWAGAWCMRRPLGKGEHILIFLYPPSGLGFTSPVGGSLGQVALDPSGKNIAERNVVERKQPRMPVVKVSVIQLERAIRSAREE